MVSQSARPVNQPPSYFFDGYDGKDRSIRGSATAPLRTKCSAVKRNQGGRTEHTMKKEERKEPADMNKSAVESSTIKLRLIDPTSGKCRIAQGIVVNRETWGGHYED